MQVSYRENVCRVGSLSKLSVWRYVRASCSLNWAGLLGSRYSDCGVTSDKYQHHHRYRSSHRSVCGTAITCTIEILGEVCCKGQGRDDTALGDLFARGLYSCVSSEPTVPGPMQMSKVRRSEINGSSLSDSACVEGTLLETLVPLPTSFPQVPVFLVFSHLIIFSLEYCDQDKV
jgi:hypothetical protein